MSYESLYNACQTVFSTPTVVALNDYTNVSMSTPFTALDWPIVVAWETSDLSSFMPQSAPLRRTTYQRFLTTIPGASSMSAARQQPMSPSRSTAPVTPGSSSRSYGQSSQMSTGAKAGIAIGASLVLLVLVAIPVMLIMRRRRIGPKHPSSTNSGASTDSSSNTGKAEMESCHVCEVNGIPRPAEADDKHARVEMDSNWHGHEI